MHRDWLFLDDIAEACQKIKRYVEGKTMEEFVADELTFDATLYNIQIIGEAAKNLPEATRALRPEIPWTRIVGLRNLIVHHYFGVDEEIVWSVATERIDELLEAVEFLLKHLPSD